MENPNSIDQDYCDDLQAKLEASKETWITAGMFIYEAFSDDEYLEAKKIFDAVTSLHFKLVKRYIKAISQLRGTYSNRYELSLDQLSPHS